MRNLQQPSPTTANTAPQAWIDEALQQLAASGTAPVLTRRTEARSEATALNSGRDGDSRSADDKQLDAHADTFRHVMQRGSHDQPGSGHGGGHSRDGERRDPATLRDPDATPSAVPISASGVFGTQPAQMPATPVPVREADTASLGRRIGDAVERLMVGDGRHGNRQVRMDLKDDLLEGVSVTVQELDGRIQVDFACAVEYSRLRLNQAAPDQARELATRLSRDVLLRIHTGDESDEHLLEVVAQP